MNNALHIGKAGETLEKYFEGLHDGNLKEIGLQPKLCPAGWWTVGYGHVVIDPSTGQRIGNMTLGGAKRALGLFPNLSEEQATLLLAQDNVQFENAVKRLVEVPLQQNEFDALVSFDYNTGGVSITCTLVQLLNKGKRAEAANEFLRWNKARVNGQLVVLPGLTRRRKAERELFLTGKLNYFA